MGRRALRKPDPTLDLSSWLLSPGDLPIPWNPEALFGRRAPVEIDVGCGKGLFVLSASTQFPDIDFLGVEIAGRYARHAAGSLAAKKVANARVMRGDAQRLFRELLPDVSISAVHVYFPDPWWKARHKKRRVMNDSFVRHVERCLTPGGQLHFWTDVEEYYDASLGLLSRVTTLTGPHNVPPLPALHDLDYRTHFERRMRLNALPVYRAQFLKPVSAC